MGNAEVVKLLLQMGADVDAKAEAGDHGVNGPGRSCRKWENRGYWGCSFHKDADLGRALRIAAGKGHVDTVKLLLGNGVHVDAGDQWGQTSLMIAAGAGQT